MKIFLFLLPFLKCELGSLFDAQGEFNPCNEGFKFNKLIRECEDINECERPEKACKTGQKCINSPGR